MNREFENWAARAAPSIFVCALEYRLCRHQYALDGAAPLTYLSIRMALVVGLMAIIVVIARPKWPDSSGIGHSIVAGILVHGFSSRRQPRLRSRIPYRRALGADTGPAARS